MCEGIRSSTRICAYTLTHVLYIFAYTRTYESYTYTAFPLREAITNFACVRVLGVVLLLVHTHLHMYHIYVHINMHMNHKYMYGVSD